MTIKAKLILSAVVSLVVVVTIIIISYLGMSKLATLQNKVLECGNNSEAATEAAFNGLKLYQVIATAELNRNLDQSSKDWAKTKEEVLGDTNAMIKLADTSEEKSLAADVKKATEEVVSLYENNLLPLLKATKGMTPEVLAIDDQLDKHINTINAHMSTFKSMVDREEKAADEAYDSVQKTILGSSLIIGLIGLAVVLGFAVVIILGIMKPLNVQLEILKALARGDLTGRVDEARKDEFGQLGRSFNQFVDTLRRSIGQVSDSSVQVASAASQLHSTADQIATGAEEVASQSGTLATASVEMAATSGDIAQNCQRAAENARRASDSAKSGGSIVRETIDGMVMIANQVKETAQTVENLGARSEQIGAIVGTIEDIADQTNLLALNAAIEAARAGEQGRGFAVVADEVRALAERTGKATREISEMIKSVQLETKDAVASMERGVRQVEKGTEASVKSGKALEDILEQINEVAMQINQIATAVEEQTATTSEITSNINQISDVVNHSARGASETAQAAAQLSTMAEALQGIVRQFKMA